MTAVRGPDRGAKMMTADFDRAWEEVSRLMADPHERTGVIYKLVCIAVGDEYDQAYGVKYLRRLVRKSLSRDYSGERG